MHTHVGVIYIRGIVFDIMAYMYNRDFCRVDNDVFQGNLLDYTLPPHLRARPPQLLGQVRPHLFYHVFYNLLHSLLGVSRTCALSFFCDC